MKFNKFTAYIRARKSKCDMNDFNHINKNFFEDKLSLIEYASIMDTIENKKFFEGQACLDAMREYPIDNVVFDFQEPKNKKEIAVVRDKDKQFASINVESDKITLSICTDPFMTNQQEVFDTIDILLQDYVYKKFPEEFVSRIQNPTGVEYIVKVDTLEDAGPIQFPTGGDNGFSGVRNGSGDVVVGDKNLLPEESEESENNSYEFSVVKENEKALLATAEQFSIYRKAQEEGKYNMLMDARKVIEEYFNEVPITEEQYIDIIKNYEEYMSRYDMVSEGIISGLIGGAIGITIGPNIGKAIAKAFGCEKGAFYDFLTSRAFTTALGIYIGGKK